LKLLTGCVTLLLLDTNQEKMIHSLFTFFTTKKRTEQGAQKRSALKKSRKRQLFYKGQLQAMIRWEQTPITAWK